MNQSEFSSRLLPMKDKIFRFARSIVSDEAEAEDITQDIYEKLWIRREALGQCTNLDGFVMSSVRNLCYDRLRNRRMKAGKHEVIKSESPLHTSFAADTVDMNGIIGTLMASLPEKQRTVVHLRDVEGFEIEAIAATVEMEEATVRVVLSRARKTLREELTKIMNYGIR